MGEGGPVSIPPYSNLLIGSDGTVTVRPLGQTSEVVAVVDRIKLVTPDIKRLSKGDDGLLSLPNGETATASADVRLISGSLEQSNVNAAMTLVNMIELSRQYEMQVNMIREAKDNADASAELLNVT